MLVLAYDTETTGLFRGGDYTSPDNPFLAAIAMILYDSDLHRVVSSFNTFIQPEGWVMPEEASAVNGLTTEYLSQMGISAKLAIPTVMALAGKAELFVAHNIKYDSKVIAAAMWRYLIDEEGNEEEAHGLIEYWNSLPTYCTMQNAKPIVGAMDSRGRLCSPKLTAAYEHFFGRPLDRAHSANADAVAALEIYLAILKESNNETITCVSCPN
jgi:DNA polymerase III epsilon subunit-like protein